MGVEEGVGGIGSGVGGSGGRGRRGHGRGRGHGINDSGIPQQRNVERGDGVNRMLAAARDWS